MVERELSEGGRHGAAEAGALKAPAAVTGGACKAAVAAVVASGTSPDATRPGRSGGPEGAMA